MGPRLRLGATDFSAWHAAAQNRDAGRESLQVKSAGQLRIQNGGACPRIQKEGKTLYRSGGSTGHHQVAVIEIKADRPFYGPARRNLLIVHGKGLTGQRKTSARTTNHQKRSRIRAHLEAMLDRAAWYLNAPAVAYRYSVSYAPGDGWERSRGPLSPAK